jgi:trans-AT polyketide synthase/acyltransferase/oxidoreductase domain-containing protein
MISFLADTRRDQLHSDPRRLMIAIETIRESITILRRRRDGLLFVAPDNDPSASDEFELAASLPPIYPEWLGDRGFTEAHEVRFPYIAGEMANGIASATLVTSMGRAGMLAFFGAAGLAPSVVEENLLAIKAVLDPLDASWGSNLIHSPAEPEIEQALVDLYLRRGVTRVSASAFMTLTAPVVQYAVTGLRRGADGRIARRNHLFAKVSRAEVAALFMSPPSPAILQHLLDTQRITADEAAAATAIPLAEDVTVEADSGGHTDNRPLIALLPTILSLRDALQGQHRFDQPVRVGIAGGLATPASVAACFALGAAYVMTGSINQASVEAGLSHAAKRLLAEAGPTDIVMAPSADMFELGVKVQVLKRGTMFAMRASKLYQLYEAHASLDALPPDAVELLERQYFRRPIAEIWNETRDFFARNAPAQIALAERNPKHRMALVFRWYLGLSSRWAIVGAEDRVLDYQLWCGPAMGAFNQWVKGSFLEPLENREIVQIARNLMEGAAVIARAQQLRSCGVALPSSAFDYRPRRLH